MTTTGPWIALSDTDRTIWTRKEDVRCVIVEGNPNSGTYTATACLTNGVNVVIAIGDKDTTDATAIDLTNALTAHGTENAS
jgi:hypothetical protein